MKKGDTYLIPTGTGEFCIKGSFRNSKKYMLDTKSDIVAPLSSLGYKKEEIFNKIRG